MLYANFNMKSLIVSLKTSTEPLDDFKKALKSAPKEKLKDNHFEFSLIISKTLSAL